jgi:hypothetical protein
MPKSTFDGGREIPFSGSTDAENEELQGLAGEVISEELDHDKKAEAEFEAYGIKLNDIIELIPSKGISKGKVKVTGIFGEDLDVPVYWIILKPLSQTERAFTVDLHEMGDYTVKKFSNDK